MTCEDCKFYENECDSHFHQELMGMERSLEICEIFFPKCKYIDAIALVRDLEGARDNGGMGYVIAQTLIRYVRRCPTVDAVEVVHGRWVLAKPRVKGRNATYRCTACGKLRSSYYNDVFQWEYCPCGAKMDGDGNE